MDDKNAPSGYIYKDRVRGRAHPHSDRKISVRDLGDVETLPHLTCNPTTSGSNLIVY